MAACPQIRQRQGTALRELFWPLKDKAWAGKMAELDIEEPGVASALVNPALGKQSQLDQDSPIARKHSPTGKSQVPVRDLASKKANDSHTILGGCGLHRLSCVTPHQVHNPYPFYKFTLENTAGLR